MTGVSALPSRADTASDLRAARSRVAALQRQLDRLTEAYASAEAEVARTEALIQDTAARAERLEARMVRIRERLQVKAKEVYEGSGTDALEMLITSDTFAQFSDRMEFLSGLVQDDKDLMIESQVTREELGRTQADLAALSERQANTVAALANQRDAIAATMKQARQAQADLERRLERERAAAAAAAAAANRPPTAPVRPGGALNACPVGQPRSFVDSFGAPRPGGRTHQGIDMMAPLGTPIFAAQSGRFEQNYNSLGGISALLFAANGDYTYYAHMSSYAGVGNGATVSAGTMIGHVGNTGDAQGGPFHLHFEYHPGGGGAVNPYGMLRAVCG